MRTDSRSGRGALFWGMRGDFSALALEALLRAKIPLCGVVLPATIVTPEMAAIQYLKPEPSVSPLPFSQPYIQRTAIHIAWEAGLPVWEVRHLAAAPTVELVTSFEPSVALVACFPWRIPEALLEIPVHGFLNLHPSLLPDLRGPYPLFWSFRLGQQKSGVTVHRMDNSFDTGPVALQRTVYLPDGIDGAAVDQLFGRQGGGMLALAAQKLAQGALLYQPQAEGGPAFARPDRADFTIPTTWSARRAFNFMRGTAIWNHPYHINGEDVDFLARQAISYERAGKLPAAMVRDGRDAWIQFAEGVLHAR